MRDLAINPRKGRKKGKAVRIDLMRPTMECGTYGLQEYQVLELVQKSRKKLGLGNAIYS
jgi:hypothetical protein